MPADIMPGQRPQADLEPVGDGLRRVVLDDAAGRQRAKGIVGLGRLGGIDQRAGGALGASQAGAGDHAAAADRCYDRIERARLVEQFHGTGRLAGDHPRIGIGMHQIGAVLGDDLGQRRLAGGGGRFAFDDLAAIAAHRGLLHLGRIAWHDDGRLDASPRGGIGQGLGVIARGMGGDTPGRLLVTQAKHRVAGAAGLEGTGLLQVFALEEQRGAAELVHELRGQDRCRMDMCGDPPACGGDIVEGGELQGHRLRPWQSTGGISRRPNRAARLPRRPSDRQAERHPGRGQGPAPGTGPSRRRCVRHRPAGRRPGPRPA